MKAEEKINIIFDYDCLVAGLDGYISFGLEAIPDEKRIASIILEHAHSISMDIKFALNHTRFQIANQPKRKLSRETIQQTLTKIGR